MVRRNSWQSLNSQKSEVALSPTYRIVLTLQKIASYIAYQMSRGQKRTLTLGHTAGHTVSMVTYYVTKMITTPMIA